MNDLDLRDTPPPFWRSRLGLGWLALAAVAGWFLLTEHRAHLFGALPWLVLLACPLMHVFMPQRAPPRPPWPRPFSRPYSGGWSIHTRSVGRFAMN